MAINDIGQTTSNRINIYLIKPSISSYSAVVQKNNQDKKLEYVSIEGVGRLYYERSSMHAPSWVDTFFLSDPAINKKHFMTSGIKAVLLTKVNYKGNVFVMAITFGGGRFLINDHCIVE